MQLEIGLFAGLKCNNPALPSFEKSEFHLEIQNGTTIGQLREILALDPALPLLTMVNNHHEQEEWVLHDNDRIGIFPPIGGG